MVLLYSGFMVGGMGLAGICMLTSALQGNVGHALMLFVIWGIPILISFKALPSVIEHTISGKPYPNGVSGHGIAPLLSVFVYVCVVPGLLYMIASEMMK